MNNLCELLLGVLLAPISILYLLIGRFCLAKIFFANGNCSGCGLCAESCPVGAIGMRGKSEPRPFWRYNCESCMRCMAFCPERAIEASQPWCVLLCVLLFVPFTHWLLSWLGGSMSIVAEIRRFVPGLLLDLPYIYLVITLSYYPFHWLSRTRFFNALFTWTTGTHYFGRHREPETRLSDLRPAVKDAESKSHTGESPAV